MTTSPPMQTKRTQIVLHPVLLAAYAVLFVYSTNLVYAEIDDALAMTALAVAGALAVWALLTWLMHDLGRAGLITGALVVIFFFINRDFGGQFNGTLPAPLFLAIALVVLGAAVLVVRRFERFLPTLNTGLSLAAAVLLAFPLMNAIPYALDL